MLFLCALELITSSLGSLKSLSALGPYSAVVGRRWPQHQDVPLMGQKGLCHRLSLDWPWTQKNLSEKPASRRNCWQPHGDLSPVCPLSNKCHFCDLGISAIQYEAAATHCYQLLKSSSKALTFDPGSSIQLRVDSILQQHLELGEPADASLLQTSSNSAPQL